MAWTAPLVWTTGRVVTASDLNAYVSANDTHLYGSIATFTPTLNQSGAVACTTATGRYRYVGNNVYLHCFLDPSAVGGGATAITIGAIPAAVAPRVSAATIYASTADVDQGTATHFDSGTAGYPLKVFFASSSTLTFTANDTTGGGIHSVTIAVADSFNLNILYEPLTASA